MRRTIAPLAALVMALGTAHLAASQPGRPTSPPATASRPNGPVHSDFNGDGFADVAVGIPYEDVGTVVDAGAVSVLYGSGTGLQATAPDDQLFSQGSNGVQDQAETGDEFGAALAAADFNGDGYADLAIGVRVEDFGTVVNAGAVNVIYGSACGLQADPTCGNPDDQFWTQDSPGVQDEAENYEQFGIPLSAGDFNGDGFADLVVGVPNEAVGLAPGAGSVNVLFGSACGLQADPTCGNLDDEVWNQDSPSVKDRAELDGFGAALTTGDFNHDGFDDLAVGVPLENLKGARNTGAVNVLYGSAAGLQARSPDDQFWNQGSPDIGGDGNEEDDHFGISLASGDFNGDGFADLAIGARYEDIGTVADAGAVTVLYGSAAGLQDLSPDDQWWNQDSPGIAGDGAEVSDLFGYSVAAADFNQDGFADLAIGAPSESVGTVNGAGAMNVLYGSAAGLQVTSPDDQLWNQDTPGIAGDGAERGDQFGTRLGPGDFNGDGFPDIAVAVRFEDVGSVSNAGAINVLYGSAAGLQDAAPDDQFWNQDSPDVQDQAESNDRFGNWVTAGD